MKPTLLTCTLGLMSGTSMDGIDVAIIQTDGGSNVLELGDDSTPYHPYVHTILKATEWIVRKHKGNLEHAAQHFEEACEDYFGEALSLTRDSAHQKLADLKVHLNLQTLTFEGIIKLSTDLHIQAVHQILKKYKLRSKQIDVIGYHGQTLYHNPKERITIQIGDGAHLAKSTGIKVVGDFRTKDVESGGQGAPFAPLYHQALAVQGGMLPLVVVNCGGIGNVTVIQRKNPESLIGFDTGPGNALVDRFVSVRTEGKAFMDQDGMYGHCGKVNPAVLSALHHKSVHKNGENYLHQLPPKSLDVGDAHLIPELDGLSVEDGCATLEFFTAQTIVESLLFIKPPYPKLWVLGGGGWHNPVIKNALIQQLKERLGEDTVVKTADEAGWNSRALEAQIFAYFAVRRLKGFPTSYPNITGVEGPLVGGQIFE